MSSPLPVRTNKATSGNIKYAKVDSELFLILFLQVFFGQK